MLAHAPLFATMLLGEPVTVKHARLLKVSKRLLIVAMTMVGVSTFAAESAPVMDSAAKERSRLEELFIWKTSEELKLEAKEELKFTETIRTINARRRAANVKMDQAVNELTKVKSKADADKALAAHHAALREIQSVQNDEVAQLKKLLGSEKAAQYLVVKSAILEKLKTMLSAPAPAPASVSTAVDAPKESQKSN